MTLHIDITVLGLLASQPSYEVILHVSAASNRSCCILPYVALHIPVHSDSPPEPYEDLIPLDKYAIEDDKGLRAAIEKVIATITWMLEDRVQSDAPCCQTAAC
jgi:hypothetical protein